VSVRTGILAGLGLILLVWPTGAGAGPGDRDPRFSRDGVAGPGFFGPPIGVFPGGNGRVLVAGDTALDRNGRRILPAAIRLTRDGALDRSYGDRGVVLIESHWHAAAATRTAVASEGRRRSAEYFKVGRNGVPERDFGEDGLTTVAVEGIETIPTEMAPGPDGSAIVSFHLIFRGSDDRYGTGLARLLDSGRFDPAFGDQGFAVFEGELPIDLDVDAHGRISTLTWTAPGDDEYRARRYTPTGHLDATFSGDGIAPLSGIDFPEALASRPSGGLVVAAPQIGTRGLSVLALAENGLPDQSFSGGTASIVPFGAETVYPADVAVDERDRILVGGSTTERLAYARFLPDGRPDRGFAIDGSGNVPINRFEFASLTAIAPMGAERVVVAGHWEGIRTNEDDVWPAIARLGTDGPDDLDGDGSGDRRDRCIDRFGRHPDGCPRVPRSIRDFKYDPKTRFFKGSLASPDLDCDDGGVSVFEVREGPDHRIGRVRAHGRFLIPFAPREGRYRAVAAPKHIPSVGICRAARSEILAT